MNVLEQVLYPVIDEMNPLRPPDQQLEKSPQTVLYGSEAVLDSMGLVTFIVSVEDRIEDLTEVRLTLASEKAMSRRQSPFRTVGALSEYVQELLEGQPNA